MVKATLTFEKAGSVDVEFKVEAANAKAEGHHDHAASADMEQPADPLQAIPLVMKALFETPENPLAVEPVIVDGHWAVAGWAQGEKGGRALLKKGEKGLGNSSLLGCQPERCCRLEADWYRRSLRRQDSFRSRNRRSYFGRKEDRAIRQF